MSQTRVVHIRDKVPGAVYIGRAMKRGQGVPASKWGNPFKLRHVDRGTAIDMFEHEITQGNLRHLLADLPELRGKALACWCRHDGDSWSAEKWCHGDVLVRLLETYSDDELRALAVES
jgi:hypothetical protein